MCVIIEQKDGQVFPKEDFIAAAEFNRDGIGIAIWELDEATNKSVVKIGRWLQKDPEDAWKYYDTHAAGKKALIHLRYKTHGATNLANCHPFRILDKADGFDQDLFLMHNGIIAGQPCQADESDTAAFARSIKEHIAKENLTRMNFTDKVRASLEKMVGQHNKLAFFDETGAIFTSGTWVTYKGFKCSNQSYFYRRSYAGAYTASPAVTTSYISTFQKANIHKDSVFKPRNFGGYKPKEIIRAPLNTLRSFSKETLRGFVYEESDAATDLLVSLIDELAYLRTEYTYNKELAGTLRPKNWTEYNALFDKLAEAAKKSKSKKEVTTTCQVEPVKEKPTTQETTQVVVPLLEKPDTTPVVTGDASSASATVPLVPPTQDVMQGRSYKKA